MMGDNRSIVFTGPGQVEMQEAPLHGLADTSFRVRNLYTAISSGSELALLSGEEWTDEYGRIKPCYPLTPGYCAVGEVVEVGPGCYAPGLEGLLEVGDLVAHNGSHKEYTSCGQGVEGFRKWWPVPEEVDPEVAVWTNLAATVLNGIRKADLCPGENAAVIGLGVLGQLTVRLLVACWDGGVVGIDHHDCRALAIGGGKIVEGEKARGALRAFEAATYRTVYVCTGTVGACTEAFDLCAPGGTVVSLGTPHRPGQISLLKLHQKGLTLVGACSRTEPADSRYGWTRIANGDLFLEMAAREGPAWLERVNTHVIPATAAPAEAWATAARHDEAIGVLINWREV